MTVLCFWPWMVLCFLHFSCSLGARLHFTGRVYRRLPISRLPPLSACLSFFPLLQHLICSVSNFEEEMLTGFYCFSFYILFHSVFWRECLMQFMPASNSLCSQRRLEIPDAPASTSQLLGWQVCPTMPGSWCAEEYTLDFVRVRQTLYQGTTSPTLLATMHFLKWNISF